MKGLAPDVALLPASGIYVMTAEEALEAAAAIQPKVAIPMHVGEGLGLWPTPSALRKRRRSR
jgi:L-ascorbate metabolism protein UlaG (beta-lactamase superfamily)